jgi:orotate phosphoribosyltransferase
MSADTALHESRKAKAVVERTDPRFGRLRDIIASESFLKGDFVLASGRKSNYLFQLRQTTLHPEGAHLIADIIVDFMKAEALDQIGGLELGAVPVVTAVALVSHLKTYPVAAFFVRKAAKEHGARELVNGYLKEGGRALIIDDVTTTGGSILKAVAAVAEKNCYVTKALSIVDREEGAAQELVKAGIQLFSIFRTSDFADLI